jgi:lipopolysaccharide export system protein LptA
MSNSIPHLSIAAALAACLAVAAHAERADRLKPIVVEADTNGKFDLQKQTAEITGNVVITKGTMVIRASRVELSKTPGGYDKAVAYGAAGKPASFRQKRDGVDEYMEGDAERIEYDGKTDVVRFINNATVRRLRGATLADEINGNLVTYDSISEVASASGGGAPTVANPDGRVRMVLTPREGTEAAAEAAQAAASSVGPLKMTPTLPPPKAGDKR